MLKRSQRYGYRATTPVFNCTPDKIVDQIGSQVFVWEPVSFCDVPDDLIPFVERKYVEPGFGMFVCYGDEDFDFDAEKRKALIRYIQPGGRLHRRITNYTKEMEEAVRRHEIYTKPPAFVRAIELEQEIRDMLGAEAPIEDRKPFIEYGDAFKEAKESLKASTRQKFMNMQDPYQELRIVDSEPEKKKNEKAAK